ncbi:MAG: hypothetical protein JKY56_22315 [Kofleriaceae bacterium]|nr:hypothetical protein [Kofleriaceae bacterium]
MARIRIVDEWLRSPVSPPLRQRAIMVVARQWAEQRVLMRAFASCHDQTRPTINLHGSQLSIGPAGTDPHGEWGIHVDPPVDGRAQELREALELAAKLLAGSKGNPPRLADEGPQYEDEPTGHWVPNNSQNSIRRPENYYEPVEAKAVRPAAKPDLRKTPPAWGHNYDRPALEQGTTPANRKMAKTMMYSGAPMTTAAGSGARVSPAPTSPILTPQPVVTLQSAEQDATGQDTTEPDAIREPAPILAPAPQEPAMAEESTPIRARRRKASKTQHGFSSAQANKQSYAVVANKTMPMGFNLEPAERAFLDALGERPNLSASEIGALLQIDEPMLWMAALMDKLASFGLDLVAPGEDRNGEPTYVLVF